MSGRLQCEIEALRTRVNSLARRYNLSHPEVVKASRELDKKIVKYLNDQIKIISIF